MEHSPSEDVCNMKLDERVSAGGALAEEMMVEDFISKYKFFSPHEETAARILRLNEELSDSHIEKELESLPPLDVELREDEVNEAGVSVRWFSAIVDRVSAILFHDDEASSERVALTEEEARYFFQKNLSERIYNRLSMLSRTPHARKQRPFSIREELTEGIAVNIGLGLYRHDAIPDSLRERAEAALLDLAWEFQDWLVHQREGVYNAPWGQVRAEGVKVAESNGRPLALVVLVPDVESRLREDGRSAGAAARSATGAGV